MTDSNSAFIHRAPTSSVSGWRNWGLTALVVYWLLLFAGTHYPNIPRSAYSSGIDKICHFLGFAGLAFLASLAWHLRRPAIRPLGWSQLAIILLVLSVYGSLDEITQPLVNRGCEFADWIADIAGAALGLTAFAISTKLVRCASVGSS